MSFPSAANEVGYSAGTRRGWADAGMEGTVHSGGISTEEFLAQRLLQVAIAQERQQLDDLGRALGRPLNYVDAPPPHASSGIRAPTSMNGLILPAYTAGSAPAMYFFPPGSHRRKPEEVRPEIK